MIKTITLTKQRIHRMMWAVALATAAVTPAWAQAPTQAEAQTKLDSVATYLAKTVGYPKATATARVDLQTLYDAHHSAAATMTADTYADLTAKLATFRTTRTDIQFPTPDAFYYLKAKGYANASTSTTAMGTYSRADVHVFHTATDNGKFQWETTRNAASFMKYVFQTKGTSVPNSFALRHFDTNTYISANVNKTSTPFNFFLEPRGDGRFVLKRNENNRPITAWKNGRLDAWTPILEYDYFYFEFEEADLGAMLTITSNIAAAGGQFSWNGQTITGAGTIMLEKGQTITNGTLTYTPTTPNGLYTFTGFTDEDGTAITSVDALAGSKTIKANFTPAFFSTTYGEKWVRVGMAGNPNIVWGLANTTDYNGSQVTTATLDFASAKTLWCFVGTADNFKIYNKVVGEDFAVTSQDPANGVNAVFAPADEATAWTMRTNYAAAPATAPGFTFSTQSSDGAYSLNSFGGAAAGNRVAYWSAQDAGSHWVVKDASLMATITTTIADLPASVAPTQSYVGILPLTFDGVATNLAFRAQTEHSQTLYLPKFITGMVGAPMTSRAYTINTITVNGSELTTEPLDPSTDALTINVAATMTDPTAHTLFASPDSVHGKPFRIPAIGRAFNGDLIALSDYRPDRGDVGYGGNRIDLVAKISKDNGQTWTNTIMVAEHSETDRTKRAYGDAAIATDRERNRVLVLGVTGEFQFQTSTLENRLRLVSIYGDYNQETGLWEWTEPRDITDYIYTDVLKNQEKSIFTASGKLMQSRIVKIGEYYRLYNVLTTRAADGTPNRNRVLFSDDFGATWHHLGNVDTDRTYLIHGDEGKCEELPDGTLIITSRANNLRRANVFTYGDNAEDVANGRGTWGAQTTYLDGHGTNATNGETYFIHVTKKATNTPVYLAMQTVPAANGRANVTFFYKEVDLNAFRTGNLGDVSTWQRTQLSAFSSAYSTFALQADGKLGFFIEELPDGKNGNYGYDMNYFARTIEQLTDDQYTLDQTLTLNESGYATFVAPYPVQLPATLEVFTAHVESGSNKLTLTAYGSQVVAANTPVIIKGAANTSYTYQETHISQNASATNSQLFSVAKATNTSPRTQGVLYYTLGHDSASTVAESAGFYVTEKEVQSGQPYLRLQPSTVYLKLPATDAIRGYRFNLSPITAITSAIAPMVKAATIYDLQGRRQSHTAAPGIYIVDGQKVVIK
ncbi:MAG: sialidase family protein [Bacteroidales bacterium]|nr:sialidase family protein [Bacteroidales bacterium]